MGLLSDEYVYDDTEMYDQGGFQGLGIGNPSSWSEDYNSSFELEGSSNDNPDYWGGIWDFANTELGMGIIGGVAGGIQAGITEEGVSDRYDKSRADALALQEKNLEMQERAIALQEAALADKIETRRKHNVSINKKSPTRRKAKFAGRT